MNLFDDKQGDLLKVEGMAKAAKNRKDLLATARSIAKHVARTSTKCTVTTDDVGRILKRDYGVQSLGPAAGSIFKGKEWEFTGNWVKSKRITNHSRMLREWRLIED